jgi:hypothetical protein
LIRALSTLVVRTAELVEAEGRTARGELIKLLKLGLYYIATCLLAVMGLLVVASGVFLALSEVMKPAGALLVIGAAILAVGGVTFILARSHEPG